MIGKFMYVSGKFFFDNCKDIGNICNWFEIGGGGLWDIGVYVFGFVWFVMGFEVSDILVCVWYENGVDVVVDV